MATLLALLLVAAAAVTAIVLTRRAVRHWRYERAGRPYELPENHLGTVLRAAAATSAALVTATLAVTLLGTTSWHRSAAAGHSSHSPAPATTGPAAGADPAPSVPPPPSRTPHPAPPPPTGRPRTVGHPAGGTLQVLADGTRVWLPPWYDAPRAQGVAYPVILARVPPPGDDDLYAGLVLGVDRRVADPFIVVSPRDCGSDAAPVLAEAGRLYRTLGAAEARAALGVGPGAVCAVREALASPGRYAAAVGVSGTYPRPPADGFGSGPFPPLLLAAGPGQSDSYASARALSAALRPQGADVRLLDGVARRRELFVRIAGYLTEQLDGPARVAGTVADLGAEGPGGNPARRPAGNPGGNPGGSPAGSPADDRAEPSVPPAPDAPPGPVAPPVPLSSPAPFRRSDR